MVAAAFIGGYLEVLENLVTALYSESRENDFLSPEIFDKGPLLPVYSMGTETWDKMKVT